MSQAMKSTMILVTLTAVACGLTCPVWADVLWKVPIERNLTIGETRGDLIVRDDKMIFESVKRGDDRVIEYDNILELDVKPSGYEFHLHFINSANGKKEKYVLKFTNDRPENRDILEYIRRRMVAPAVESGQDYATGEPVDFPFRIAVELDLNGNNCIGTLVVREDKIIFETVGGRCANRAFVRDWEEFKSYSRVKPDEFLLVFYKYGSTAPDKITRVRFFTRQGPLPTAVHQYFSNRNR
ncbi:MAG: hypothetical protein JXQ27_02400 [Acidobacteria bacterium]|nr:hypothetical protein [Acidobacteriota bacterium]